MTLPLQTGDCRMPIHGLKNEGCRLADCRLLIAVRGNRQSGNRQFNRQSPIRQSTIHNREFVNLQSAVGIRQ